MSGSAETIDMLLVTLASMGFDLERGQAAVQAGKLTVQEAVEWLLQGGDQSREIPSRSAPTLSLRPSAQGQGSSAPPSSDQNYLPFSLPPVSIPSDTSNVASAASPPSGTTDSETDPKVVSRYTLSDKKREDKDRWEREQREAQSAEFKEERLRKKKAHSQVLKEIEADRKAKLLKKPGDSPGSGTVPDPPISPQASSAQDSSSPPSSSPEAAAAAAPSSSSLSQGSDAGKEQEKKQPEDGEAGATKLDVRVPKQATACTLQIRLPSGQHMREKFPPTSTLKDVVDHIRKQHPNLGDNVEFLQPFPRKVFSSAELANTVEQLGLTPSGTLVIRTGSPSQAQAPSIPEDLNPGHSVSFQVPSYRSGGGRIEHLPAPPLPPPHVHQWGRGHAIGDGVEEAEVDVPDKEMEAERIDEGDIRNDADGEEEEEERMDVDEAGLEMEEDDDPMGVNAWGQGAPGGLPPLAALWGDHGGRAMRGGHGQQHVWGEGRRLTGNDPGNFNYGFNRVVQGEREGSDEEEVVAPSPARIAAAALQRLGNAAPAESSQPSPVVDRPVPSLLDLCVKCTSKRLEGHQGTVTRLEAVPPTLAERLLTELKKSGYLRPKTLMLFIPCHLQRLALDCYKYTTNELMQAVRPHVNLVSLNLASCPLITDQGLPPLSSLKKLQQLNISNNKQLTDKIFQVVQEFPSLTTLILEGTSVTDAGIETLVATPPTNLSNLNLNRTAVTDTGVLYLARLAHLKNLGLEQTQVKTLDHIGHLSQLVSLNIARNRLTREGLLRLHQVAGLKVLSISQVEGISGDEALACLQGLQLLQLTPPDRHTTTDLGLKSIAGMSLCSLDLADYINITDDGLHHLADMTSLQKLSITNTKVTSTGMAYLQGLTELRELHLDRTSVTDEGAKVIGQLPKLQVLSMAATKITDEFLVSRSLNRCSNLARLNLSRTDISDRGISILILPYLTLLNLDYTCVSADTAQTLSQCPSLKVVRINNLRSPRELDQD